MRILLYSRSFFPEVGGIETITLELARGLAIFGSRHPGREPFDVTVATETSAEPGMDKDLPFRTVRHPGTHQLCRLIRENDLLHLAGPAMLPLIFGLMMRKSVLIEHHGFQTACPNGQMHFAPQGIPCDGYYMAGHHSKCIQCNTNHRGLFGSGKMLLLTPIRRWLANQAAGNIMPTDWLSSVLKLRHAKTIYHGLPIPPAIPARHSDIPVFAFQGRLVSTKGAHVLLEATAQPSNGIVRPGSALNSQGAN